MNTRRPAEVFPPGEYLRDELEARGWSQGDLAEILGRSLSAINQIILGKRVISPEIAMELAAALGTSPELWLNLEATYQLWHVRADASETVSRRAKLFSAAPIKEMMRRGWLEQTNNLDVLESQVLRFLGIKSLDQEPVFVPHNARKSARLPNTPAQKAWLRRAMQLAPLVHTAVPYSEKNLDGAVARLRLLLQAPQEVRQVPRVLSDFGIRFVLVEALPGSRIDGVCFWLDKCSPTIAMTTRFDRIDNFWFVLMHELGHVARKDAIIIDLGLDVSERETEAEATRPTEELLADGFANEQLIPRKKLENFIGRVHPLYSPRQIEAFAMTVSVHPGIVLGQLHHLEKVHWSALRRFLVPVRKWIAGVALTDGWGAVVPVGT